MPGERSEERRTLSVPDERSEERRTLSVPGERNIVRTGDTGKRGRTVSALSGSACARVRVRVREDRVSVCKRARKRVRERG